MKSQNHFAAHACRWIATLANWPFTERLTVFCRTIFSMSVEVHCHPLMFIEVFPLYLSVTHEKQAIALRRGFGIFRSATVSGNRFALFDTTPASRCCLAPLGAVTLTVAGSLMSQGGFPFARTRMVAAGKPAEYLGDREVAACASIY